MHPYTLKIEGYFESPQMHFYLMIKMKSLNALEQPQYSVLANEVKQLVAFLLRKSLNDQTLQAKSYHHLR